MKLRGLSTAIAISLALAGCGGGGSGTSTSINLRTVLLLHTSTFGTDNVTVAGSQSGNVVASLPSPSITGFNSYSTALQSLTATDVTASPNTTVGTVAESSATANAYYTVYVTGIQGSLTFPPTVAYVLETPPAVNSAASQVRYANFSTSLNQAVDVYFTAAASTPLGGLSPAITNVAYGTVSLYAAVPGGSYFVQVTAAGTQTVLYTSAGALGLVNGFDYTTYGWDSTQSTPTSLTQQDMFFKFPPGNV